MTDVKETIAEEMVSKETGASDKDVHVQRLDKTEILLLPICDEKKQLDERKLLKLLRKPAITNDDRIEINGQTGYAGDFALQYFIKHHLEMEQHKRAKHVAANSIIP